MRRLLAGALLCFAICAGAPAVAQPATEEALTRLMADRFRQALPGLRVTVAGQLQLEVFRPGSDDPTQVYLDRVWNVCRAGTEEECESSASHFVTAMRESFADQPAVAQSQLRVMVRSADYCEATNRLFRENGRELPLTRAGPADLCTLVVADYPNTMRVLRPDDLGPLGLTADATWALALRQTMDRLPDPPALSFEEGGFAIITGQDYTPSVILDEAGWRALVGSHGGILMAVPEDGVVVVARSTDVDASSFRDAMHRGATAAERPISSGIYRWTERGWEIVR